MLKRHVVTAVRKCRYVYGYVRLNEDHGVYVRLTKSDLLASLSELGKDDHVEVRRSESGKDLYIN